MMRHTWIEWLAGYNIEMEWVAFGKLNIHWNHESEISETGFDLDLTDNDIENKSWSLYQQHQKYHSWNSYAARSHVRRIYYSYI